MAEYEIVDEETGEIVSFKTTVDIKQLEEYNQWVIDKKLNPATYSPKEYAEHVEAEKAKLIVAKAKEYLAKYNMGMDLPKQIIDKLERILDGEE